MSTPALDPARSSPVDLSKSDSSELVRGRPAWFEALWLFIGSPLVESRYIVSSGLRASILRFFGAKIGRNLQLKKPGLKVKFPWYLSIGDNSWVGAGVWIDNLAPVTIGANVAISNEVTLCTGNHDYTDPHMRLFRRPIVIEDGAWLGVRTLVGPGVTVHESAIASAGSVILKDIPANEIHAGNPARFVRVRRFRESV